MIDKILVFGDSFNYGHGCSDRMFYYDHKTKEMIGNALPENVPSQFSWSSLLQNDYPNIQVLNFANPGRANAHIFRDFLTYSQNDTTDGKNTLVFYQLTNPDRIEVASHDNKKTVSLLLSNAENHPHKDMGIAVKGYVKWMYEHSIGTNQGFMAMLSAYALAKLKNYNYYWSGDRGSYPLDTFDFILSHKDMRKHTIMDVRNIKSNVVNFKAPDYHINDVGHKFYYNTYIKPVVSHLIEQ